MPACMGGWCAAKRDSCRHYHAADRVEPAERLCERGEHDLYSPIQSAAEPAAENRAQALIRAAA